MLDMNEEVDIVHDAESTGLLDEKTVDYTTSPWTLRDTWKMHVIAVQEFPSGRLLAFYDGPTIVLDGREHIWNVDGNEYRLEAGYEPLEYLHFPLHKFKPYVEKRKIRTATAHNGIGFDLLAYKVDLGIEYTIGDTPEQDTWGGKHVYHNDTLVQSKCQNPDRFGGHSLLALSKLAGDQIKQDFRKHLPPDERFKHFAPDMLWYNLWDVKSNKSVKTYLDKEADDHPWLEPIQLEKCTADIVTQQSHRGFHFNMKRAEANILELDQLMEERRLKVEPVLPPKKATKGYMKDFTPPKRQFKKDGSTAADLEKFIDKIGATRITDPDSGWLLAIDFDGKQWPVPLDTDTPLRTEAVATLNDTTHIKEWLVSLGWSPSEYKEKDLTVKTNKIKLTEEEYEAAVDRYVLQTLNSPFCEDRCEFLETTPKGLRAKLLARGKGGRRMQVRTNPSFTVGQDKEMCRGLAVLSDKFPFAKDVVEYLTYKHRRNSILGGGAEWDEDEEPEKGYLASVRSDGRIPTPADSCGAATSRMKHRVVANIPRVTSLYGGNMREQFEADPEMCYQIGYDFASLEAREEGHYCWDYEKPNAEGVREYVASLLLEKPHDVHTRTAELISKILGRMFARGDAKAVKYGCTYGAQAAKVAKTIGADLATGQIVFDAFWLAALPLSKLKEALQKHWEKNGKKFIKTIDGRKVPTRAAHAILNSLFQSAGVICAKRTMVIWMRKLREAGLSVDFWTEDWKNKSWATQMIAYHDEAQIEVTKDLVKFKRFPTKEECNAFRDSQRQETGMIWSEAQEAPKGGFFVAYSLPGQLVVEAVAETTEYYKMKVPLSADYVVGKNWKDCH